MAPASVDWDMFLEYIAQYKYIILSTVGTVGYMNIRESKVFIIRGVGTVTNRGSPRIFIDMA